MFYSHLLSSYTDVPYWYILIRWHVSALQAEMGDQAAAPELP